MNETWDNHKTGKLVGNAAGFRLSYGTTIV